MFEQLPGLPADPILGLMLAYREDRNPNKVDLGVGVYRDEDGHTPILKAVLAAQRQHIESETTKSYIGPPGEPEFNTHMRDLIFGRGHAVLKSNRVSSAQTPGGCGALRVGAELINRANPGATIWVSDPTWANHVPLLGDAGLKIKTYPYFDPQTSSLREQEMMDTLSKIPAGDLVLLHGCCHNPCGVDLAEPHWQNIAKLANQQGFTPFIDMAYQGLSSGVDEDALGVRLMADAVPELVVASSCSKNFGLYRDRVGAIAIISSTEKQAGVLSSQLMNVIRGIYSMPPNHGGAIVKTILADEALTSQWLSELSEMRERINGMRDAMSTKLATITGSNRFDFIRDQRGMFSFLGIDKAQIAELQKKSGIYIVDSSRINVAGVSSKNIDYVCDAIAAVL
ncbi:MAG: amino acid aminotransferase [Gammaproteobacteria bacterium]